jgi:hypothetical protein
MNFLVRATQRLLATKVQSYRCRPALGNANIGRDEGLVASDWWLVASRDYSPRLVVTRFIGSGECEQVKDRMNAVTTNDW